jgi:hypothetical protein
MYEQRGTAKKYECTFCRISNKKSTFNPQALNYQRIVDIPNHQTGYISKYYSDPQLEFPLAPVR